MAIVSQIANATSPSSLILKGGQIYNPQTNRFERKDLKIVSGTIAAKEENIELTPRDTVRVLPDNYRISAGWKDLHMHCFGCWGKGMDPIRHGLYKGATLQVDAGSAGMSNFEDFAQGVLSKTNGLVLAMLNIAPGGLARKFGENRDLANHDPKETAEVAIQYSGKIKMIKIRLGKTQNTEDTGKQAITMAKEAAKLAGNIPLMVHIEDGAPLEEIFNCLDAGDIVTHAFRKDGTCCILDDQNRLQPFVINALKRGVRLDVGHGAGGFHKDNAIASMAALELLSNEHFEPFTTSTDLHCFSLNGPVYDLPTTIAKMISLGMKVEDAIASVTKYPAESLRLPESTWRMGLGDPADLTVWRHEVSEVEQYNFIDPHKVTWKGKEMLSPKMVYVNGQLIDVG